MGIRERQRGRSVAAHSIRGRQRPPQPVRTLPPARLRAKPRSRTASRCRSHRRGTAGPSCRCRLARARLEAIRRHHGSTGRSGSLRAAVFGINDGLVSNFSLVLGMAGADQGSQVVVLAGVAGLVAGAFSMAAGEYVSMRVQREVFEGALNVERRELVEEPGRGAARGRGDPAGAGRAGPRTRPDRPACDGGPRAGAGLDGAPGARAGP